jgi:hypothetical protein
MSGKAGRDKRHLIDICHEEGHPKIAGHHSAQYKSGWLDGYDDATGGCQQ